LKTGRQVEIVTRTLVKIPIDFSVSFPKNYFIFYVVVVGGDN
jgi:hypothetical protein